MPNRLRASQVLWCLVLSGKEVCDGGMPIVQGFTSSLVPGSQWLVSSAVVALVLLWHTVKLCGWRLEEWGWNEAGGWRNGVGMKLCVKEAGGMGLE